MIPYLTMFLCAWICAVIAQTQFRHGRTILGRVWVVVAAVPPAILAGFRDESIGTDTAGYVATIFARTASSGGDILEIYHGFNGKYEPGYLALAQVVHYFPTLQAFLLIIAAVTNLTVVSALAWFAPKSFASAYLAYHLVYFCESLNASRQGVALSFALLFAVSMVKHARLVAVAALCIAVSMHYSSLVIVALVLIFYVVREDRREIGVHSGPWRRLLTVGVMVVPVVVVLWFEQLAPWALDLLGADERYGAYLGAERLTTGIPVLIAVTQIGLAILCVGLMKRYVGGRFVALSVFYGSVLFSLTGYSQYLWRVGEYLVAMFLLGITCLEGIAAEYAPQGGMTIRLVRLGVLSVLFAQWVVLVVLWGNHGVYPYASQLLGVS